jgi:phage-related protein
LNRVGGNLNINIMKKLKSKFLLPVMAFLLAITAAFATQAKTDVDDTLVPGYIFVNGICEPARSCNLEDGPTCTYSSKPVFAKTSPTMCPIPLHFPSK